VDRRAAAAEDRLSLVGRQALDRAQTGPEQGGDGDESAAAGDRIDKAREQGEAEQDQGDLGESTRVCVLAVQVEIDSPWLQSAAPDDVNRSAKPYTTMHALDVQQLTKTYKGGFQALKGIDLTVEDRGFLCAAGTERGG
jgi:hypothetical protein